MTATATKTGYETLTVETTDHVCTITLNRPDVFNAFSDKLSTELAAALKSAARDSQCRVVVLTGSGKAFSSGQDLGELKDRYVPGYVPELSRDLHKRYNPIIRQVCGMEKPVIAAVNGVAAGAGCSLALACDLRIASEYASFVEVFVNVGLIPDSGSTYFLPRLIGHARAMELCCTGRKVKADEALALGLVNKVVPAGELLTEATAMAQTLAAMPARAIALTKRLLHQSAANDLESQLEAEAFAQETAGKTRDHMEGVVAFLEKRTPEFTGEQRNIAMTEGTVGIIGAGTMGAGIAQVAATRGWTVRLRDVDEATVIAAIAGVVRRLDRLVEKGRVTEAERDAAAARLLPATSPDDLAPCDLVIEAIVEDLGVKTAVLREIVPVLAPTAIIATNTSSLSVSALGEAIGEPARTVGMHFFNPAPLLKLVEVVAGDETDPAIVDRIADIATSWGKTVARAADVPGFIVNHVARPYYLEAFRILEDGHATAAEIDAAMTTFGGFRMGPFALTDLIGQDVNTATTRSVWAQLDRPPLLAPSELQERLVADGHLGRKTGRGVYDYETETPTPALTTATQEIDAAPTLRTAVSDFASAAVDTSGDWTQQYVFARILVALIAQATLAHQRGVAAKDDIDTAMRFGVNYPEGPFAWARRIGVDRCTALLEALDETTAGSRFAVTATV